MQRYQNSDKPNVMKGEFDCQIGRYGSHLLERFMSNVNHLSVPENMDNSIRDMIRDEEVDFDDDITVRCSSVSVSDKVAEFGNFLRNTAYYHIEKAQKAYDRKSPNEYVIAEHARLAMKFTRASQIAYEVAEMYGSDVEHMMELNDTVYDVAMELPQYLQAGINPLEVLLTLEEEHFKPVVVIPEEEEFRLAA